MLNKKLARKRRSSKTRYNIKGQNVPRLAVHRSSQHIYAQVFSKDGAEVVASASSLDKEVITSTEGKSKTEVAKIVGAVVAERAKKNGIASVAFDRSGFKYHGRIKALADAARENGLLF